MQETKQCLMLSSLAPLNDGILRNAVLIQYCDINCEGLEQRRKKEPQCHLQRKAFFSAPDEKSLESDSTQTWNVSEVSLGQTSVLILIANSIWFGMVCFCPVSPLNLAFPLQGSQHPAFPCGKLMQSCKRQWYPLRFGPFLPFLGSIIGPCALVSC